MKKLFGFIIVVGVLYLWCSMPSKIEKAIETHTIVDDYVRVYKSEENEICEVDICDIQSVSKEAIENIKRFEGCRLVAYLDSNGLYAIGYGHIGAKEGDRISEERANELFMSDISKIEDYLVDLGICRTQGEFDSLASFIYNVGTTKFENSALLSSIRNSKGVDVIKSEFMRWVYANGKELQGLKERRTWEASQWI